MRDISCEELRAVSGGNAQDSTTGSFGGGIGTNSGSSAVTSGCYTIQVGPATSQTCVNSDGTKSVQTCIQVGPSGSLGGVGLGVTGQICSTTSTPIVRRSGFAMRPGSQ